MIRTFYLALAIAASIAAVAMRADAATPPAPLALMGVVADPTGAIVPGAQVDLVVAGGALTGTTHSDGNGNFLVIAPHPGNFTLVISESGFQTVRTTVVLPIQTAPAATPGSAILHIVLPIASTSTTVQVNAQNSEDLTAPEENRDSSVMTSDDLKALPIFDNDYATAMSAFLDQNVEGTGGSGLLVDGVEANRSTVSASAVKEVRINQDPFSAQYYWPGRGQMEIITKSAADHYHGQVNFIYRNSVLNAQNALAPSNPPQERQTYEGSVTGPIPHAAKSSFLGSFNRVIYNQDAVVSAVIVPTVADPSGLYFANVSNPYRDTEFSTRAAHQFNDRNSGYAEYSFQDASTDNQGVGGQTLSAAGYNNLYREDDMKVHYETILSPTLLNQLTLVTEHDFYRNSNTVEAPAVNVSGYFSGGSAQGDAYASENNLRIYDMATWTRGRHLVKFGLGVPHLDRRAYDDNTNALGSYTFGPTLASDGVTVLQTALQNYENNLPSGFSQNTGDTHFVYHQQEVGAFIQDQFKITPRFSITPGLRYDWQNFLANRRLGFSPRLSFALVLDPDRKVILRGGGGIYYDRFGSGPILDLTRYGTARRRSITLSMNPADPAESCYPITACQTLTAQPPNIVELAPNAKLPYQIQTGLSIERQLGERATGVVSVYSARGIDSFRSVDINAPTPESGYTTRSNAAYGRIRQMQPASFWEGSGLDISYRGRWNKYFTGFGRYTWSHYISNTGGIGWFPQNQFAPNDEWSDSNWDSRNRLGMYAIFQQKSILNLAAGIFAHNGNPWTVLTGTDLYGDGLFNTRPTDVARNSETGPSYVDMDLRWGHEFALTPSKDEDSPHIGFSAAAFNVLNHPNINGIDNVETSSTFSEATSVGPARRIQLAMRFLF